ncbi:MAG: hypothetical protein Q8928_12310 [Bacteroidota bacterium]|nr:hypothetical protein [Bacteroidota bacterium]
MKICKVLHRNEERIKIDAPFNREIITQLRQIPDARWSKTLRAWHIPYTQAAFNQLKILFPDVEYPVKKTEINSAHIISSEKVLSIYDSRKGIFIEVVGRRIFLKMSKNDTDVQFVKSFRFSRWNQSVFCWIIPNYPGNLELLKDYFKERLTLLNVHPTYEVETFVNEKRQIGNNQILMVKTLSGRVKVVFGYNKVLSQALRKVPYSQWSAPNRWWSIPYAPAWVEKITALARDQQLEVIYEEEKIVSDRKPRLTPYDIPNYRLCPSSFVMKLKELRYSENTLKTYVGMFEEFINFYHKYDIDAIDEGMITAFFTLPGDGAEGVGVLSEPVYQCNQVLL